MAHRYTKEQIEYIREITPGRYNEDIAALFNERFGTNVTKEQMRKFKANHGLRSNVPNTKPNGQKSLFTLQQKEFIKQNVKGIPNKKLAEMINNEFGLSITAQQIKTWKKNHGFTSGLKGSEGTTPANKGTKGIYNVGGNKTSFKKGKKPMNYLPVGSERIGVEGYTVIKVSDTGTFHERWRAKHKVIWEEAYGPVPDGHVLIFSDGNRGNITLENLMLVTRAQLGLLNQNGLIFSDAELTKTGVIIADILTTMAQRKRDEKI